MPTLTRKQLERRTGVARLQTEDLMRTLESQRQVLQSTSRRAGRGELLRLIDAVIGQLGRLSEALDVQVGLTVEQAAHHLNISEPTVRKWVREGLLDRVDGRKPLEVTQESVVGVDEILARVREHYPDRDWTRALATYLHDQSLMNEPWLREGVAAYRAGKLVEM